MHEWKQIKQLNKLSFRTFLSTIFIFNDIINIFNFFSRISISIKKIAKEKVQHMCIMNTIRLYLVFIGLNPGASETGVPKDKFLKL